MPEFFLNEEQCSTQHAGEFRHEQRKGPKLMATVAKPPFQPDPRGAPPMVARESLPREEFESFPHRADTV